MPSILEVCTGMESRTGMRTCTALLYRYFVQVYRAVAEVSLSTPSLHLLPHLFLSPPFHASKRPCLKETRQTRVEEK